MPRKRFEDNTMQNVYFGIFHSVTLLFTSENVMIQVTDDSFQAWPMRPTKNTTTLSAVTVAAP